MTQEQYANSLGYIFGPDLRVDTRFAPMRRTEGLLANGAAFAGVSRLQRQRLVNAALGDIPGDRVHALAIKAKAPGE